MTDIFAKYGLRRLLNLSGKETANGAAETPPEVVAAVAAILPESVDMLDLQAAASGVIARVAGSEAGFVTGCVAAGLSVSVAACVAGTDIVKVEQLPDTTGMKNEAILQKGHDVHYGSRLSQKLRLPGARVVEVGTATDCAEYQLRGAIGPQTAAAVFVWSHHCVLPGLLDLRAFASVCREAGVPVIVDAANEYDWPGMLAMGADLVIFSAHKAARGPTAGIIAGREDLVRACMFQERGIGRPMKAGKEGVIGAMAALELWERTDHAALRRANRPKLEAMQRMLAQLPGLRAEIEPDVVGQPVDRLALRVDPAVAGLTARGLAGALSSGDPKIAVYALREDMGKLLFDTRAVDEEQIAHVCARIREALAAAPSEAPDERGPRRHDQLLKRLHAWPARPHLKA